MSIFPVIVGTILFVVVMVCCGAFILFRYRAWQRERRSAEAHVLRLEGSRTGEAPRGKKAWPVVEYVDAEGARHEVRLSSRVPVKSTAEGDAMTVYYLPDRPYAPRLGSAGEVMAATLSFGLAGVALVWMIVQILTRG